MPRLSTQHIGSWSSRTVLSLSLCDVLHFPVYGEQPAYSPVGPGPVGCWFGGRFSGAAADRHAETVVPLPVSLKELPPDAAEQTTRNRANVFWLGPDYLRARRAHPHPLCTDRIRHRSTPAH